MASTSGDGHAAGGCRELPGAGYDAYRATVLPSVGRKDAPGAGVRCSFKAGEATMRTAASKGVRPDAIFQCGNDTKGVVSETKSSMPRDKGDALRGLEEQIAKCAEIKTGGRRTRAESGSVRCRPLSARPTRGAPAPRSQRICGGEGDGRASTAPARAF